MASAVAPSLILVLDGGAGRRMGGVDKGLLPLAETDTMLDALVRRLRAQGGAIAISANGDAARFAAFGLPVLSDTAGRDLGPLAGVLAGLDHMADHHPAGWLLTVPADTPLIPADLADRLASAAAAGMAPCICAVSCGRRHALVALWSGALRPALRDALIHRGLRRVEAFQREVGCSEVAWAADPHDPFLNVNTPEDLAVVRRIAAGEERHALRIENT